MQAHKKAIVLFFFSGCVLWALTAFLLDNYGRQDNREKWDAIVVAGCRVNPGGQPSLALSRRTKHAVRLWHQGKAPVIAFTGGLGKYGPSEAAVASHVALSLGVPKSAIVLEESSTSTEENAYYARQKLGNRRVLVVTDSYHVFRAERVFAKYFSRARAIGSTPRIDVRLFGAFREVLAVAYYYASGKLSLKEPAMMI